MVVWSVPAKEDLKNIHNYIAKDSKYYALKTTQEFIEKSERLSAFPQMGRIVPEIGNSNMRELIIFSYRLIYEISPKEIEIIAIIHAKQEFPGDLDEFRK